MSHGVTFSDGESSLHYRASLRVGQEPCIHKPEGVQGYYVDQKTGESFWATIPAIKQYCTECMSDARDLIQAEDEAAEMAARMDTLEDAQRETEDRITAKLSRSQKIEVEIQSGSGTWNAAQMRGAR